MDELFDEEITTAIDELDDVELNIELATDKTDELLVAELWGDTEEMIEDIELLV